MPPGGDPVTRRTDLAALLAAPPVRTRPATARIVSHHEIRGAGIDHLVLDLGGDQEVPAIFARPLGAIGRIPAVIYHHSHGGRYAVGKSELVDGAPYLAGPWLDDGIARGWAMLAIDHRCFGERNYVSESAAAKLALWQGTSLWALMLRDALAAGAWLRARDDIDPARVAVVGMSMGAFLAHWHAALDPLVTACVDCCGLLDYDALIADGGLDRHGIYAYVPGLLARFSALDVNALIAPRPRLALVGDHDALTPATGVDRLDAGLRAVYAAAGASEAFAVHREPVGHVETLSMRAAALGFLTRWL